MYTDNRHLSNCRETNLTNSKYQSASNASLQTWALRVCLVLSMSTRPGKRVDSWRISSVTLKIKKPTFLVKYEHATAQCYQRTRWDNGSN